jgi:hypothetical protein
MGHWQWHSLWARQAAALRHGAAGPLGAAIQAPTGSAAASGPGDPPSGSSRPAATSLPVRGGRARHAAQTAGCEATPRATGGVQPGTVRHGERPGPWSARGPLGAARRKGSPCAGRPPPPAQAQAVGRPRTGVLKEATATPPVLPQRPGLGLLAASGRSPPAGRRSDAPSGTGLMLIKTQAHKDSQAHSALGRCATAAPALAVEPPP